MNKEEQKQLIDVASKRKKATLCIKNAKVVDVFNSKIFESDVLIKDKRISGFAKCGEGKAEKIIDVNFSYMIPGFIDSHVHIESSHCTPEVFSNLLVSNGVTTVIADPHEICNCHGIDGLDYMLEASENLPLKAYFMIPSCVPATSFEHSGAVLDSKEIAKRINHKRVLGLGEMMDYPGVINNDDNVIDKIQLSHDSNKIIDGHSPNVFNSDLDAYCCAGIKTDHECATKEDLEDRISRGMYVMLREGTVCRDELNLLKGVTKDNYRRCLFCTDDRQVESLIEEGSINNNVRLAVENGLDPVMAISMASINGAQCYNLKDVGAIAPRYLANFSITKNLKDFDMEYVFVEGEMVAKDKKMIKESEIKPIPNKVKTKMNVKNFSIDSLKLPLKSNKVRTIDIVAGGVVTQKGEATVEVENGLYKYSNDDICKIVVVERHNATGNSAVALLKGFGLKQGAIATSVAHDSHNIIAAGKSDEDIYLAIEELIKIGGGMVITLNNKVIGSFSHPIAGLMSNLEATKVSSNLSALVEIAYDKLGVKKSLDPFMTLCFMSLPVIPEYKITDMGLFDVTEFKFVNIEL
ncbi:MAG: adenine deaminase [Sphaerochaetaceae bacterium]|nr:adenine deaminase [Sphaerochaetaceae bacterium]